MKVKFTDEFRYPHGYTHAAATDIRRTFARARAELKVKEAEKVLASNVKPLRKKT